MTDKYTIDFTDQNSQRQFIIQPYSTDGPEFPTSNDLSSKASRASTSLLLYGKGVPNYGERIAENFVHLLENFAGNSEPTYPVAGQLWYRKDITPSQLHVYNETWNQIVTNPGGSNNNRISISGDHTSRFTVNFRFRIFNPNAGDQKEEYTIATNSTYDSLNDKTIIELTTQTPGSRANGDWYVGGWEPILQDNTVITENLDLNNNRIINVADAQSDGDALNRLYADNRYVNVTGDTMTGLLTLNTDPINPLHAATKQYVDNQIDTRTLLLNGNNAMNANLNMGSNKIVSVSNPTQPQDAATKQYVDNNAGGGGSASLDGLNDVDLVNIADGNILVYDSGSSNWINSPSPYVRLDGSIAMTGRLTLSANPNASLHAATKQYVDNQISGVSGGDPISDTGHQFDPNDGTLTISRDSGSTFDITGFNYETRHINHQIRPYWQNGNSSDYLEARYVQDSEYPNIPSNLALQSVSEVVGASRESNKHVLITTDGVSTIYNTFLPSIPASDITNIVTGLSPVVRYPSASAIVINGDWTDMFTTGDPVYITGGGNQANSPYTVSAAGVSYDGGTNETTIPIDETLVSTTVDNDSVLQSPHFAHEPVGADNDILFYSKDTSLAGRETTIELIDPQTTSSPLSVTVSGNDISVSLETDGSGNIITTAEGVALEINNDAGASALIVAYEVGTGTGVATPLSQTHLEGIVIEATEEYSSHLPAHTIFNLINTVNAGQYTVDYNGARSGNVSDTTVIPITTLIENEPNGEVVLEQRNADYVVGKNHLHIHVNGQRYYADQRGYASLEHNSSDPSSTQSNGFFPAAITGLTSGSTYSFRIAFDGAASYPVSIAGADATFFDDLVNEINLIIGPSGNDDGIAVIENQRLVIYSKTTGTASSVALINDPVGSESSLISGLIGEDVTGLPVWSGSTAYTTGNTVEHSGQFYYALEDNQSVEPGTNLSIWRVMMNYIPRRGPTEVGKTLGFSEIGHYGQVSDSIQFTNAPAQQSVVEAVVTKTQAFAT